MEDWNLSSEVLHGLAAVASARGDAIRAARLAGASGGICEVAGVRVTPEDELIKRRHLAPARERLGAEDFTAAWAEGNAWSLDEAVAYALADGEPPAEGRDSWSVRTPDAGEKGAG